MTDIELNPTTGLPKLDEGLLWRVRPLNNTNDEKWTTFQIEIVRPRLTLFGRTIYEVLFWNNVYEANTFSSLHVSSIRVRGYHNLTDEVILASAKYLLYAENVSMIENAAVPAGKAKIGLYPPLTVKDANDDV